MHSDAREADVARAEALVAQADAAALAEQLSREHRARQQVREADLCAGSMVASRLPVW